MSFAPAYLIYRAAYTAFAFLKHWYIDSFFAMDRTMRIIYARLDRTIALRITLRNLFQPLYQDYTYLGYLLGFLFRSVRLAVGGALYGAIFILSIAIFAVWLAIPAFLVYKIIA